MKEFDKKYLIVAESGDLAEIKIFDKVRDCIVVLKNGKFTDETENCKKLSKKKVAVMGGLYYQLLKNEIEIGQALIYERNVVFFTDDENEVNEYLLNTRIKQLEFLLENAKIYKEKFEIGKQSYTYKHIDKI